MDMDMHLVEILFKAFLSMDHWFGTCPYSTLHYIDHDIAQISYKTQQCTTEGTSLPSSQCFSYPSIKASLKRVKL